MRPSSTYSIFALAVSALAYGCAAPTSDDAPNDDGVLEAQTQKLTEAQCGTQRDTCFSKNPLFGLFTCPAQYAQCIATANDGLPAEVSSAITEAAQCTKDELTCQKNARNAAATLACTETAAKCIATIVDADLPDVVDGTVQCVDSGASCINDATKVSDLANCAKSLTSCAVQQVQDVLPPEVGEAISSANACRTTLNSCIASAETAAAITQCSEDGAKCIAGTLGVKLPDVPLADVVNCGETATDCALHASSIGDIDECASGLSSCAADVVGSVPVPPQLTCEQKWTACMTKNPLNFLKCGADLASCQD